MALNPHDPVEVTLSQEAIEALARLLLSLHAEEKRAKASKPMTPKQQSGHCEHWRPKATR